MKGNSTSQATQIQSSTLSENQIMGKGGPRAVKGNNNNTFQSSGTGNTSQEQNSINDIKYSLLQLISQYNTEDLNLSSASIVSLSSIEIGYF